MAGGKPCKLLNSVRIRHTPLTVFLPIFDLVLFVIIDMMDFVWTRLRRRHLHKGNKPDCIFMNRSATKWTYANSLLLALILTGGEMFRQRMKGIKN